MQFRLCTGEHSRVFDALIHKSIGIHEFEKFFFVVII